MKKVFYSSLLITVLFFVLVLQTGVVTFSQQGLNPAPPQGPNNCDDPNRVDSDRVVRVDQLPGGPISPAGPPCPPIQQPSPPINQSDNQSQPLPPQGPNDCDDPNRQNDPFGPGPHIGTVPSGPVSPLGPPCPELTSPLTKTVHAQMLLPPSYRVGSAPFLWVNTTVSAYVYVIDVDPQRQVFALPGVQVSTANAWHLFGEGTWLENPIGTDSINLVASATPLPAYLEAAVLDSQNYELAGQYYILNQSIQQQLAALGADYIHQGYQITN